MQLILCTYTYFVLSQDKVEYMYLVHAHIFYVLSSKFIFILLFGPISRYLFSLEGMSEDEKIWSKGWAKSVQFGRNRRLTYLPKMGGKAMAFPGPPGSSITAVDEEKC